MTCDLAIIGSGGAALAAAMAASGQGARIVIVERSQIGGTCVNAGCVPSKALLAAAGARHAAAMLRFSGIIPGPAAFAGSPADPVLHVALNRGEARRIDAGQYLVATGSAPWVPPVPGLPGVGFLTSAPASRRCWAMRISPCAPA